MTPDVPNYSQATSALPVRVLELFRQQQQNILQHTDHLFLRLMLCQWVFGIGVALWFSPRNWTGTASTVHPHVWIAVFLGGIITALPVLFAWKEPGKKLTRHVIAVGQVLMSALLIHLSGGRIETHFHIFGSLAILAFYRDWRVLISASAVVYADHILRGIFWPESVYGVLTAPLWRSFEHAGWVAFEVTFLIIAIRKSMNEMLLGAERQASLEAMNETIERTVTARTAELTHEVMERRQAEEELRKSQAQLSQAQKMEVIGRLAGGIAHDFNNLLTVINGYCALSVVTTEPAHPVQKNIGEIQKAADRAASLTGQLLAFSRKQVLQPRVLQLNKVVHDMEKMLRRIIGEDIQLATSFEASLGNVQADPGQIEQVIMNLVINARDAMPRGGKLTISTSNLVMEQETKVHHRLLNAGNYVMLAITDTGMGMTEEVKLHLFEPFFTTKGVGKGTGLGLATCYGIIRQSDGDIGVYSEKNHGTTFKIYLPRTDAEIETTVEWDSKYLPSGTEKILVVEDDVAVRNLAVTVLHNCGYDVQEAANAFEALALIKKNSHFDLVLTDVVMPQMSGKELFDQVRSQLPQIDVLLMSGYTDDALAHHGVLQEGLHFLEKPFSPAKLARKVREVIEAGSVRRLAMVNGHPVLS